MASLFDGILEQMAETDREVLKKYPKIQEKVVQLDDYVSRWEKWRTDHWDDAANMPKSAAEALRAKDAELAAIKAMQDTNMEWSDIEANVKSTLANYAKEQGLVSRKQVEEEIIPKLSLADVKELKEKLDRVDRGMTYTYGKTGHYPLKYFREFGDGEGVPEFTQEAFLKHMSDTNTWEPEKAYDSFVAPLRTAKSGKDLEVMKEQIRKEEREKTLREVEMKRNSMPDDNTGSASEMSALQMRIANRKKVEVEGAPKLTPGELGSGVAGNDAYQAYLRDIQNGTKPQQVQ